MDRENSTEDCRACIGTGRCPSVGEERALNVTGEAVTYATTQENVPLAEAQRFVQVVAGCGGKRWSVLE